jgi:hypothetical protein
LQDVIREIELALEETKKRDIYWMTSWEWIQILTTGIQVSNRRRQWRIDPMPLVGHLLRNLEMIQGDQLDLARVKLHAFLGVLDDYTTETETDISEIVKMIDGKQNQ